MGINECVITVRGNGTGGHGVPVRDRTGTIRSFLVDNQVFYSAVQKHLKTCQSCSPNEVLEILLERRKSNPKFGGETSETLVRLALRFRKLFGDRVQDLVVNEYVARSGVYSLIQFPERTKGLEYLVFTTAFDWVKASPSGGLSNNRMTQVVGSMSGTRYYGAAVEFRNCVTDGRPYPEKEDFENVIAVAQVMAS